MTDKNYPGPERRSNYETVLESKLSMLHEDVGDIKSALKDLTSAITRLALVEERMATASAAQERAIRLLESLGGKHG